MIHSFSKKIRRPSVIKIDEVMIADMTNYRNELVNYMLYEEMPNKATKQEQHSMLIDEIRSVESWIKNNSKIFY